MKSNTKEVQKEVKSSSTSTKENLYLIILNRIKSGANPTKICEELGIKKQKLNYYLSSLKAQEMIKKIGYGLWAVNPIKEVQTLSYHTPPQLKQVQIKKQVRGHAFIWKIRTKPYDWTRILQENEINYDSMGIHSTPRVILNGKKIWLGQKHIVIYESDSYYAFNSVESKKLAIFNLLQTMKVIEGTFHIDLSKAKFTCSKEHYSVINNCLAIQCDNEGKKIDIKNEEGYWMSIDNSLNLHEAEAVGKDSMLDVEGIKKYFNSHKETNFKVTPEFVLNTMNGIQQNQLIFAENMKSHIDAIKKLGEGVERLTTTVQEMQKERFK